MKVRISVAMASYNGEKYIAHQLDSIIANIEENDQIVISDDGSSDGTIDIIRDYMRRDNRIILIDGPRSGVIANFENAIYHCDGGIVFLADQDDEWSSDKVKRVMREFDNPKTNLVMHDAVVYNSDLTEIMMPSFYEYRGSKTGKLNNIWKNSYMGCCMAFRRELVDKALPIPRNIQMHDQWIGLINDIYYSNSVFIKDKLLLYRRHENAASDFSHHTPLVMVKLRMILIGELRKRRKELKYKDN